MPSKKIEEEYEIVPVSPLRKLEKKIEMLESSSILGVKEILGEMRDIMKMSHEIIRELSKANDALRIEVMKLVDRIEKLTEEMEEFLSFLKEISGEEEVEVEGPKEEFSSKINELIELNKKILESNQAVLNALEEIEKRLRRPVIPIKRPRVV